MGPVTADDIAKISTFAQLITLLRKLEWPIPDDAAFDDVVYEYEPHELRLKPEETAKIREIHQLRPLATNQPWGIFFISFEPKQIPVVVLRRVLRNLVVKKRADPNTANRSAWDRQDLLFISAFGEGGARELAFAHFSDGTETNDLPVLRVLGWNERDTQAHNDYVARMLREKLHWPADPANAAAWREAWSTAFELRPGEVVRTSKELSVALAGLATGIRRKANALLKAEADDGPMRTLLKAFRENLIEGLTEDDFADMFAQTISYGLLAARISRPAGLVADNLADMIPTTNPFLKDLFETFLKLGGRDKRKEMDFDELGVRDVVDMLNRANMEAVLRDFGDKNPKEDPVIHFYELFLKEYDPEKRMQRGVFYTPRPVVNFIVRGVDEVLRIEFGLPLGLADITTWEELAAKNNKITIPAHVDRKAPFVQILDPATGTGTFLVETIDLIHTRMVETWKKQAKSDAEINAAWNEYVPRHLLPRLTGYELMMAPYAIAHMKVGLKLGETGYRFGSDQRARVFLTNSLEPARDHLQEFDFIAEALAHEALAANQSKAPSAFTVIVGNPPYSLASANLGAQQRALVERYRFVDGERIIEKSALQLEKNLNDDYVKFVAVMHDLSEHASMRVISFVSNHSFLDNPTLRGMRWNLLKHNDVCRFLDLHGNSTKKEKPPAGIVDVNVFEIKQGVSISTFLRTASDVRKVFWGELWGDRDQKEQWLERHSPIMASSLPIEPRAPQYLFTPLDHSLAAEYFRYPSLDESCRQSGAGFISARDGLVIDFDRNVLVQRIESFAASTLNDADLLTKFRVEAKKGWSVGTARAKLSTLSIPSLVRQVRYRPFDDRWMFYDSTLVWGCSWPTASHIIDRDNLCILATRITKDQWDVSVSDAMPSHKAMSAYDTNIVFPLYLFERTLGIEQRTSNYKENFRDTFAEETGLVPADEGTDGDSRGDLTNTLGVRDIFDYTYAILHAPTYRARFREYLKSDFPRVPPAGSRELFSALVSLGAKLVALHLLRSSEATTLKVPVIRFAGHGEARVEKGYPKFDNGKVMINATRWFEDVPRETWEFHVGGYQVCEKWLKDRAAKGGKNPKPGRVLSDKDILHYRRIVVALTETRRIMAEIDRIIEEHGGWPGAFAQPDAEDATTEAAE